MNTGPNYDPITGQLKPGSYSHLNFGSYQSYHLNGGPFAPWEVLLTVLAAAVLVATVVVFVRRLRRA